ncbi:hypothetical protein [Providencia phage PSTCR5]|uniref:Cyclic-phosphate processing Receiver domain-containing protein n=1 Tax=Providencia phage PSTCR5 TaxID=2783547 RepID=A0A873WHV0_9CAUD|nr:hypothetical protein KNV68_gp138 [Providencia phage PSTCR5]QPB12220.1 hypothetical protein [Providencia phage PSTCR5]
MIKDKVLLWVDDERLPMNFLTELNHFKKILVAQDSKSAMMFIDRDKELITHIHLDNDLGEQVEGRDIFNTVEAMVFFEEFPALESITVHTSNPAAAESMMSAKKFLADMGVTLTRVHY